MSLRGNVSKWTLLIWIAFMQTSVTAQSADKGTLLALSKHDHTLALVDPATLGVLAKLPVGEDPHEVVASADGNTAYVSIYGDGRFHTLSVLDLVARKALPEIDTGALSGPHGLFWRDDKLWFTAEGAKVVARYDPATGKIDWVMGTGQDRTHMLYVMPGGEEIFTTNVSSATVSVIDAIHLPPIVQQRQPDPTPPVFPRGVEHRVDWRQTVIPVGKGDEGFDLSPNGKELWTANAGDGTLSIIDIATRKVVQTIDAGVIGANRLKFSLDGRLVLITSLRSGDLVFYDAATRKEFKRIAIGHGAAGILMEPGGARAFVACTPDNYVAVIDLKSYSLAAKIDVGGEPDGLAWAQK